MNIINVGDPRTISLLAGQTISVTTTGTITATCVSGLGLTAGATIGSIHGSTVFGSYSADGVIKLTATNRDGAYELNTDTTATIKSVTGTTGQPVLDAGSKGAVKSSGIHGLTDTARGEDRMFDLYGIPIYADITAPSATVALSAYPCEIRVSFGTGEVYSADQLQVTDPSGAAVDFQWEPAYTVNDGTANAAPINQTSIGYWDDGSIRSGSIWVNASLTGGQTKRYKIIANAVELGQVPTALVTYTVVSGTVEEYATSALRARFESGQAWQLRRYQDIGNSNLDLFSGTNGAYAKYQLSTGVAKYSYTSADVTNVVKSRPSSGNFGEGVVYRDWRVTFAWAAEPTTTVQMDYRVFSDGSIKGKQTWFFGAALTSAAKQVMAQFVVAATNLTSTTDATRFTNRYDYSTGTGSNFIVCVTDVQRDCPAKTTQTYTVATINESTTVARIGWTGTTDVPNGQWFAFGWVLTKYTAADQVSEHIRRLNPVVSFARIPKSKPDRLLLGSLSRTMIDEVLAAPTVNPGDGLFLSVADWYGVRALLQLARGESPSTALATFQQWCTAKGIAPASSASWMAAWNGATGIEYTGRNTQCLWWIYQAFGTLGDTANQALVKTYIDAFADFCVSAETASGGAGQVWLRLGTGQSAYNAATFCMAGLAASIALGADAGRQTVLDRIQTAYNGAAFAGQRWSYGSSTALPADTYGHYYAFQTFELSRAKYIKSSITLPVGNLCSYLREFVKPEGFIDDNLFNLVYRRGSVSSNYYAAGCLVALDRDYATAYELVRHAYMTNSRYSAPIDGFIQPSGIGDMTMDVRCMAELILQGLI